MLEPRGGALVAWTTTWWEVGGCAPLEAESFVSATIGSGVVGDGILWE
jgi:hypothetical protein